MEIADIYVVNKSDRPGADKFRQEVEVMLGSGGKCVPSHRPTPSSERPSVPAVRRMGASGARYRRVDG